MANTSMNLVCDPGCLLGEGPLWNAAQKKLYFTDIEKRGLWRCDPATGQVENFWRGGLKVGGFVFDRGGDPILFTDSGVSKLREGKKLETLFPFEFAEGERFNDVVTDPEGRVYAGTLCSDWKRRTGKLYLFEKGSKPRILIEGLACSNGMTFSLDLKTFYHTESADRTITRYDYDRVSGRISGPRPFFEGEVSWGLPDGLTIDLEGCLWSAFWNGGAIRRISPEGKVSRTVNVPAKIPTSVIFGGEGLRDLFITTSSWGRVSDENRVNANGEFLGGGVYRFTPEAGGRAEWPADIL